jgi:hypothetical protein
VFRVLKGIVFLVLIGLLVLLFVGFDLAVVDVGASILAFIPTGWFILGEQFVFSVRVYLVGYIFCIIDYHIYRDIFGRLYILYNRLSYMSGYIW